jgi:hypothetical protein
MNAQMTRMGCVVFVRALLLLLLPFLAVSPLRAGIIYSNLGPGNTFNVNAFYDTNFNYMATTFVTSDGGALGDILTPVSSLSSPVSFGLYTNSGGQPGALLESWNANVPASPGLVDLSSQLNPSLSAQTQYWFLIALSGAQKEELDWYQNNQGVDGGIYLGNQVNDLTGFVAGSPAPAIQLNSVPEPATAIMLGSSLLLLGLFRKIQRTDQSGRGMRTLS